jgi:hypothetical protein
MGRTSKATGFGLLLVIIGLACFGSYRLYQRRYLSSDIKRTLKAAVDPAATEADVMAYIRDARLQVHTEKDAEVLQNFETCVQLKMQAR